MHGRRTPCRGTASGTSGTTPSAGRTWTRAGRGGCEGGTPGPRALPPSPFPREPGEYRPGVGADPRGQPTPCAPPPGAADGERRRKPWSGPPRPTTDHPGIVVPEMFTVGRPIQPGPPVAWTAVLFDGISHQLPDIDPEETAEWIDSFDAVVDAQGRIRARFLLMKLLERARTKQVDFPATVSTPYVNSIPRDQEPWFPGDEYVERRIRAYIRWNAAAMVTGQPPQRGDRGAPGHLRQLGLAVRGGLQPLLPGQVRRRLRRPRLLPGTRLPRHLRPGLRGGAAVRGPARPLPPGGRGAGPAQLSPPAAAPRVLGVPHRFHGPRAAVRHLPGPRQPLSPEPRGGGHSGSPGVGLPRRRRARRGRVHRRPAAWPDASTSTT